MAQYIDGFLLVVPKKNIKAYKQMATKAGRIWMDLGALEYRECVGEHLDVKKVLPFTKVAKAKSGETVIFSYVVYKSRAHRDKVNAKIMSDPRIAKMMTMKPLFDFRRMAYGGFESIVSMK